MKRRHLWLYTAWVFIVGLWPAYKCLLGEVGSGPYGACSLIKNPSRLLDVWIEDWILAVLYFLIIPALVYALPKIYRSEVAKRGKKVTIQNIIIFTVMVMVAAYLLLSLYCFNNNCTIGG